MRGRRQPVQLVLLDRNQRINQRAVQRVTPFVSNEENRAFPFTRCFTTRAAKDWSTHAESADVFLQRQTREPERVVVKRIRVECFVAKEIERADVKAIGTTARAQIHATARSTTVLRRKLVRDHLHLRNR